MSWAVIVVSVVAAAASAVSSNEQRQEAKKQRNQLEDANRASRQQEGKDRKQALMAVQKRRPGKEPSGSTSQAGTLLGGGTGGSGDGPIASGKTLLGR